MESNSLQRYKFWDKFVDISLIITFSLLILALVVAKLPDILNENGSSIYLYITHGHLQALRTVLDYILFISFLAGLCAALRTEHFRTILFLQFLDHGSSRE